MTFGGEGGTGHRCGWDWTEMVGGAIYKKTGCRGMRRYDIWIREK
jgi:hypothetical protein